MRIVLRSEQERLRESGQAHATEEALTQDVPRVRLPKPASESEPTAGVSRRLAGFGHRHGLSLGGLTIMDLLHESRTGDVAHDDHR
jgi:hypothetical protein